MGYAETQKTRAGSSLILQLQLRGESHFRLVCGRKDLEELQHVGHFQKGAHLRVDSHQREFASRLLAGDICRDQRAKPGRVYIGHAIKIDDQSWRRFPSHRVMKSKKGSDIQGTFEAQNAEPIMSSLRGDNLQIFVRHGGVTVANRACVNC